MSVARAQEEISSAAFADWIAYYSIDPWGGERSDNMLANLTAVVANVSGRLKQKVTPKDFLPKYGRPIKQSSSNIGARIKLFAQAQKEIARRKAEKSNKKKAR